MLQHVADFAGVFDAVPYAMVVVDRSGVIRFANRQTESLFDYRRDALVGRLIETLVPESVRTIHQAQREGYVADPKTRELGMTGRKRDGTEFPLDVSLAHVGDGEDLLVIAAVRDMTARLEAEKERRQADRMSAVVEFSEDAILTGTLDGIITSWNPAAERLFGHSSSEIIGKSGALLNPAGLVNQAGPFMAAIRAGQHLANIEVELARSDGSKFLASVTISPIRDSDGAVVGASAIVRDITDQRQAFEAAQRMAAIIECSDDAITSKSLDGIISTWNPAAEKMYGYSSAEIIGRSIDLLTPADLTAEVAVLTQQIKGGSQLDHVETIRVRRDGSRFPVSLSNSPIYEPGGTIVGVSTITRDLTEQVQAALNARSLIAAEDLVQAMMGSSSIGIALADKHGAYQVVNDALCNLLGYDAAWFLTHRLADVLFQEDAKKLLRNRARFLAGPHGTNETTLRLRRADGAAVWVRRVEVLIAGVHGEQDLLMVQVEDFTAEHAAQEALTHQAFHDVLTGLHNRAWILDILKVDLRAARRLGSSVGILFVDLDHLKIVNDSLGHSAGDKVLAEVARRIATAVRPGDRVGRFGGDEFVVVVQDVQDVVELEQCAERVSAAISADLKVDGHRIVPSASIGIGMSTPSSTRDSLLRDTDLALFRAKATGRGRWQLFDEGMHAQAMARLTVEDELRHAIIRDEFVVHYQPIVTLADGRVVGYEALLRWIHPIRGLLCPGEFLDVAEDSRLITTIGAHVLDDVCAMLADRPDLPGPISVNVSAVQLAEPDWLTSITDPISRHGVDPHRIVLEITETSVLNLLDSARDAFAALRVLGLGIHVDDFGTGYSSISLLRDLPVTGVKLDLRFVHDLTLGDSRANALTQGLSGLVNGLRLTGIAEGIETEMQVDILRAQGWQCGQGNYFGRPAAIPTFEQEAVLLQTAPALPM
ncbi:MAG: bifunctional diguanylate cyclase/phosphodiesterase [Actinomycetota bacterium]